MDVWRIAVNHRTWLVESLGSGFVAYNQPHTAWWKPAPDCPSVTTT
jgi:hypothetical protein